MEFIQCGICGRMPNMWKMTVTADPSFLAYKIIAWFRTNPLTGGLSIVNMLIAELLHIGQNERSAYLLERWTTVLTSHKERG